ncbi:hypothetical protein ACROYT_G043947 [Oculina patagonica]
MLRNEDGQLTFKPGESRTAQQSSSMILRQEDVQRYRGIDPEEITKEDIHRGVGDGLGHSQKMSKGDVGWVVEDTLPRNLQHKLNCPKCTYVAFCNPSSPLRLEKDVGMCVGTGCPDFCGYCFDRNKTADSGCKYCMSYKAGACIATNYTTEAVYTGDYKSKKIHIIKECRCNSE